MLRALDALDVEERGSTWLQPFVSDFRARILSLMPGPFRGFAPGLALGLLDPQLTFSEAETAAGVAQGYTPLRPDGAAITPYDMKRLQVGLGSGVGLLALGAEGV